jgi:hypothetical protein
MLVFLCSDVALILSYVTSPKAGETMRSENGPFPRSANGLWAECVDIYGKQLPSIQSIS